MQRYALRAIYHIACVILVSWGLGSSNSVQAGVNKWTPIGPEGGTISTITIDPTDPQTIYTSTISGGLYKQGHRFKARGR